MSEISFSNNLSLFPVKLDTKAAQLFYEQFVQKVECGKRVQSFDNFELYISGIRAAGEVFSFHAISIPGFVGSLNDSFLVYGLGDNFISDVAALIEKHFGGKCKVFSEGVNLIVCLEGDTPTDMDKMIGDILKKGDFKYEINLWNIPNTEEGRNIKDKINRWAAQNKVANENGKVKVDLQTFERMIDGRSSKGMPQPRVGSFELPADEDYTSRQLKTKITKLLDWVKFGKGNGKIKFLDKRLAGTQVDEIVNVRENVELNRNMPLVLSDFSKDPGIFNEALTLTPEEFLRNANNAPISPESREFLKTVNESLFIDSKYNVLNEPAFKALIQDLVNGKKEFFILSGDLTNLGGVNREYGRLVGDGFLEEYFGTWKELAGEYSEKGIKIDIFRSGADEFGVLVRGTQRPEDIRAILQDFDSRINNRTIRIPEKYLTRGEKALLKNKGIRPKEGGVEIRISDVYRRYVKGGGGRFDVGSSHTIFGDRVIAWNKRSGDNENYRVKTGAKVLKKGANGKSFAKIKDLNNLEYAIEKDVFREKEFSSKDIELRFYSDYMAAGAPQSGIPGKALSIGYSGATTAFAFAGAEAVWGLGERTIEAINGERINWNRSGEEIVSAAKGGARFGITYGTFKGLWNLNRSAMPLTLGWMTVNDLAGTPEAYRGLALTQGVAGLGSFMGAMQLSEMGISSIFGYSMKTPGPWWIKVAAFGAGYASSKGVGIGLNDLYVHNEGFRSFVNSDLVKGSANVIAKTAGPANIGFAAYTGMKVLNLVEKIAPTAIKLGTRILGPLGLVLWLTEQELMLEQKRSPGMI